MSVLRRVWIVCAVGLLAGLGAAPALAQTPPGPTGHISDVSSVPGTVQFVLTATGLPPGSVLDTGSVVVEAGGTSLPATASIDATDATAQVKAPARESIVAIDTSGSMAGDGISGARAAALAYAQALPADVRVGLVSFSDTTHVLVRPTSNRTAFRNAIASLRAGGNTALYDGVLTAVDAMSSAPAGTNRRILVLSDGADNTSSHTLQQLIAAISGGDVAVDVVPFRLKGGDQAVLKQLASSSHGHVLPVSSAAGLANAFTSAAAEFQSQVLITVQVPPALAGKPEHLDVSMHSQDRSILAGLDITLPIGTAPEHGIGPKITGAPVGSVSKVALYFVLAMAFVALLIVALMTLWMPAASSVRAGERERLAEVGRYRVLANVGREQTAVAATPTDGAMAQGLLSVVERFVGAGGRRQKIVEQLERAGIRMRPEEWMLLQVAAVLVLAAVLTVLSKSPFGLIVGGGLGYLGCRSFIRFKTGRRVRAFSDQLPDVLQLVGGSLRSGFSLNQAFTAIVREGNEPTASEIARALTEVRLGSELEDALDRVAERMECQDLHWVVLAVRIAREVGGNLAEVITNTVTTMRERAQIRGQIRVLSAEGRISARILIALPFLLGTYFLLFNAAYLRPLISTVIGIVLLVVGAVMLVVGAFWITRLVKIEV